MFAFLRGKRGEEFRDALRAADVVPDLKAEPLSNSAPTMRVWHLKQ
jgi:hypothetical protein